MRVSWRERLWLVDIRIWVPLLEGMGSRPVMVCGLLKRGEEPCARVSQSKTVLAELAAIVVGFSQEAARELEERVRLERMRPSVEMCLTRSEAAIAAVSPVGDMALSQRVVSSSPRLRKTEGRRPSSWLPRPPM